jgi:hypothetical protein
MNKFLSIYGTIKSIAKIVVVVGAMLTAEEVLPEGKAKHAVESAVAVAALLVRAPKDHKDKDEDYYKY